MALRAGFGDLSEQHNRRRVGEWIFNSTATAARASGRRWVHAQAGDQARRGLPADDRLDHRDVLRDLRRGAGQARWGDKRPAYAGWIPIIFELFPDAQFINLVRDPRAAVASQIPLGWGHEEAALASGRDAGRPSVLRVDDYSARCGPTSCSTSATRTWCATGGDPRARLRLRRPARGRRTIQTMIAAERRGKFRPGWHDKLSEPISVDSVERWREKLDPHEIALVEMVAAPYLERFGYQADAGDAVPTTADLAELKRQRKRRRRKWRKQGFDELKRRHVLYRRPVAAVPKGV